jgi:lysophospholipase L1-like esterase
MVRLLLFFLLAACLCASPAGAAIEASLGDSYSSGEGAGHYDFDTKAVVGNGCHRTERAWPRLLGVPQRAHLACSGAQTADFFVGQKNGLLAGDDDEGQLERLRDLAESEAISRVFVTIGGNDLGFKSIILACVFRTCLNHMDQVELQWLRGVVYPKTVGALIGVRQAVGAAEVVLVGYPDVIPGIGEQLDGCRWLDPGERPRILRLERQLDAWERAAATIAGVRYVSIRGAVDGHELCTSDPWIVAINPFRKPVVQENGHPNARGQVAIAEEVARRLAAPQHPATIAGFVEAVVRFFRVSMVAGCWPWG